MATPSKGVGDSALGLADRGSGVREDDAVPSGKGGKPQFRECVTIQGFLMAGVPLTGLLRKAWWFAKAGCPGNAASARESQRPGAGATFLSSGMDWESRAGVTHATT